VSSKSFVHLHTHTEYSMLDGAARIGDLVDAAVKDGMPALGITDHGNMYGVLDFYKACTEAGINPIIGTEALSDRFVEEKSMMAVAILRAATSCTTTSPCSQSQRRVTET